MEQKQNSLFSGTQTLVYLICYDLIRLMCVILGNDSFLCCGSCIYLFFSGSQNPLVYIFFSRRIVLSNEAFLSRLIALPLPHPASVAPCLSTCTPSPAFADKKKDKQGISNGTLPTKTPPRVGQQRSTTSLSVQLLLPLLLRPPPHNASGRPQGSQAALTVVVADRVEPLSLAPVLPVEVVSLADQAGVSLC